MAPQLPNESWDLDFQRDFLENREWLPPHITQVEAPELAVLKRATTSDLAHQTAASGGAFHQEVYPVVADVDRNRLLGPVAIGNANLCDRHVLMVGPPGCHKTASGTLPHAKAAIDDTSRSVVVFDPKSDQAGVIVEIARKAGRPAERVVVLNLSDPKRSVGWNPISRLLTATDAYDLATALVTASEGPVPSSDSAYFRNQSILILASAISGLAADQKEAPTLPRLAEVFSLPRKELYEWLSSHGCSDFCEFLRSGSHNAETCLSDVWMRLMPLRDNGLCAVLSNDELDLVQVVQEPTVLIIEMDETKCSQSLRGLFNLVVRRLLDAALRGAAEHPGSRLATPLSLIIDEFGSAVGALPSFAGYLNTLRSRRVSVVAACQSLGQIEALYGRDAAAVIAGFGSKLFFAGVGSADAEFASRSVGRIAVRVQGVEDCAAQLVVRPMFLPEEIARPRRHPVLGEPVTMLLADTVPFQAYLVPSYRSRSLAPIVNGWRDRVRGPLRPKALEYVPGPSSGEVAAELAVQLQFLRQRLNVDELPMGAAWWRVQLAELGAAELCVLVVELVRRGVSVNAWMAAVREAKSNKRVDVLRQLDRGRTEGAG